MINLYKITFQFICLYFLIICIQSCTILEDFEELDKVGTKNIYYGLIGDDGKSELFYEQSISLNDVKNFEFIPINNAKIKSLNSEYIFDQFYKDVYNRGVNTFDNDPILMDGTIYEFFHDNSLLNYDTIPDKLDFSFNIISDFEETTQLYKSKIKLEVKTPKDKNKSVAIKVFFSIVDSLQEYEGKIIIPSQEGILFSKFEQLVADTLFSQANNLEFDVYVNKQLQKAGSFSSNINDRLKDNLKFSKIKLIVYHIDSHFVSYRNSSVKNASGIENPLISFESSYNNLNEGLGFICGYSSSERIVEF